jgi:hypothetical protein
MRIATLAIVLTTLVLPFGASPAAQDSCEWHAVHNWQPPHPGALAVSGVCQMPTPGYTIVLKRKTPQGANPSILLLTKTVTPPKGFVPQIVTPTPVLYREVTQTKYKQVTISPDNATIDVKDLQ